MSAMPALPPRPAPGSTQSEDRSPGSGRYRGPWLLLLMALLWSSAALAGTGREALLGFFEHTRTLEAGFRQTVYDDKGRAVQEAAGRMALQRPGRVRWEYLSPDPQLLLVDGRRLWIYDKDLAQVMVKPVREALATAPIVLLTEASGIEDEFEITEGARQGGLEWVSLRPRVQDSEFERIDFALDGDRVAQMVLFDHFGQRTVIRFTDERVNADLPADTFRFEVPEGVDVIGNGPR